MIDLTLLRKKPEEIKKLILKKEPNFDVEKLITLDGSVRSIMTKVESLRKQKNELSKQPLSQVSPSTKDEVREKSIEIGKEIKTLEKELFEIESDFKNLALSCPNLLQDDVPEGGKENNQPVKEVSPPSKIKSTISSSVKNFKNHLELNKINEWFDLNAASQTSGSNFVLYKPLGTKVLYALTMLMIKNNLKHGFEPVLPPYLVNDQALINSGNLPKFKGDFYTMPEEKLSLIPTAEVSLTNIHAGQILETLPKRYTAWTSCFRKEAGGYGSEERGLIRIHQFEKVELYTICEPKDSDRELEKMLACAEDLLQQLGLEYRVSLLAAQDCSFASSKTYDIEVWLPGQGSFYEVSSCSNCTDFQARRAKIRYRSDAKKPIFVHTLNGSSLALPRLMVAIMEQYQQEDGSIELPEILKEKIKEIF